MIFSKKEWLYAVILYQTVFVLSQTKSCRKLSPMT
nr:MAG TPA: hypothetical protein [Caudoviricetes sp.]DAX56979.1 MAG TPA: hypothetical protein [Caudoviricetes sp.]